MTAVESAVKGISRGLFVHIEDPQALAGGDAKRARRIERMTRRFDGAPFVYAIRSSPARLAEIGAAVNQFSGGRLGLSVR
ncbi:MAG: hypothetical protein ACR2ML_06905 [Solirubrobacteraceae bacterium]